MSIVHTAVDLARAGYSVGPCRVVLDDRGKKRPHFPLGWTSSTDPGEVARLFAEVGATGAFIDTEKSGIVVVDIDRKADVDGWGNLRSAGLLDCLPPTLTVDTWSGGVHLFYRQAADQLDSSQGKPVPGVDIRGLGGVVFATGTEVYDADGELAGVYSVRGSGVRAQNLPVLPAEFAAAVLAATRRADPRESSLVPFTGTLSPHQEAVLERWLEEDLAAIRGARSGERHRVLLANAAKVLDRANKLGWRPEDAVAAVRDAYEVSGGTEWEEKAAILDWAADRLAEEPMGVPEDWADPDEVRFEEAVREQVTKLRIRAEAQRRAAVGDDPVDTGRVLDFLEPEGSLYGQHWVSGVIPKGETVILFGARNQGKSFVAMDLGLSVAAGRAWHGKPVSAGSVLYLAGEGAVGLPARRRAWVQDRRTEAPEAFQLRDGIVHLANPHSVAAYQKLIVEDEIDLVIIDTVRRAGRGREIENPGEMMELVEALDDLRKVRHGCSVLALHHPTKTNPLEPAGAGTLQDAVSVIHRLSKDDADEITMETTKNKDGRTGPVGAFVLRPVGDSVVLQPTGQAGAGPGDPFEERRRREEEGF